MLDLSVVIIACNEERIIGQTLEAIATFAGEIIFVDSGSTDRTLEIARQYRVQCHHQQWLGYAAQKNYALSLATKKWILSLDADEIVTPALAKEIASVVSSTAVSYLAPSFTEVSSTEVSSGKQCDGYRIPRLMYIGNQVLKHGGFYPDAQLRLFLNGKGKFNERKVHESIQVEGKVGNLNSPLLHYAYRDFDHYAATLDNYAKLSAQEFVRSISYKSSNLSDTSNTSDTSDTSAPAKPLRSSAQSKLSKRWASSKLNEIFHPIWTFFYRYILRAGFLDGLPGLKANWLYKDYVRKKITYLQLRQ